MGRVFIFLMLLDDGDNFSWLLNETKWGKSTMLDNKVVAQVRCRRNSLELILIGLELVLCVSLPLPLLLSDIVLIRSGRKLTFLLWKLRLRAESLMFLK